MKRALIRIAAVLCIALAAFFLMPVFGGILHFGMIWPAAVLLSAAAGLLRGVGLLSALDAVLPQLRRQAGK